MIYLDNAGRLDAVIVDQCRRLLAKAVGRHVEVSQLDTHDPEPA